MFRSFKKKFKSRDEYSANQNRTSSRQPSQRTSKSYWVIVATDGPVTQAPDPRSNPVGVVAKGSKILIVDETKFNYKLIKPVRGWIARELVQHSAGWFSLTRDVAVVSQSRNSAPIKTLFGGTLVHVTAVYEKCVIIDEPVYGKFNCSASEKALLPIDLHKGWYDVRRAATVRVDRFRQSARVHTLRPKDKVQVVEIRDEAVRITHPRPGWVSLLSHEKKPVLVPVASEIRIGSWHEVMIDANVYKQVSTRSKRVGSLKRGQRVFVTERIGKSNRIEKPVRGWVRSITNSGFAILRYEQPRDIREDVDVKSLDIDTFWDFVDEKKRRSRNSVVTFVENKPAASVPAKRRYPSLSDRKRSSGADRKRSSPRGDRTRNSNSERFNKSFDRKRSSNSRSQLSNRKSNGLDIGFYDDNRPLHKRHMSGYAHADHDIGRKRNDSRAHTINRGWYNVRIYTLITASEDKESKWVRSAKPGDKVHIDHATESRAYIDRPCKGWISLKTNSGQNVVDPIISSRIEESEDGDDETSKTHPERDASSETVEDDDFYSDSTETLTDDDMAGRDWVGALDSDVSVPVRGRGESTLSQYKNPSMVLVGDSVVVRGRQGTVVGMKEDDTATLLSVQLDDGTLEKLISEAEVLPVDLTLRKQLDLQTEMNELMSYFRDSSIEMKRRQSVASSFTETKTDTFFDRMKNGGLLWENAIPENAVYDDDQQSTISKLTGVPGDVDPPPHVAPHGGAQFSDSAPSFGGSDLTSQEEVDAMMQPLPPPSEKKSKMPSTSPRGRKTRDNRDSTGAKQLEKKKMTVATDQRKYTRSRSKLNSNSSRDSASPATGTMASPTDVEPNAGKSNAAAASSFASGIRTTQKPSNRSSPRSLPPPKKSGVSKKAHRPTFSKTPSQTPSVGRESYASSSNYSRTSIPLERKSNKPKIKKSSVDSGRGSSAARRTPLRMVSEEAPLQDMKPRKRGMTSLENQKTQLQLQMSKMKQIADLTQQISDLTTSGGSSEEIKRASDALMAKLKQLMGESESPTTTTESPQSPRDSARSRGSKGRKKPPRMSLESVEFEDNGSEDNMRSRSTSVASKASENPIGAPSLSINVRELAKKSNAFKNRTSSRKALPSPKVGVGVYESPIQIMDPLIEKKSRSNTPHFDLPPIALIVLEKPSPRTIDPSPARDYAMKIVPHPMSRKRAQILEKRKNGLHPNQPPSPRKKRTIEASYRSSEEMKFLEPVKEESDAVMSRKRQISDEAKVKQTPEKKKASLDHVKPVNLETLKKWQDIFADDTSDFSSSLSKSPHMSKSPLLSPMQILNGPQTRSRTNTPLEIQSTGESVAEPSNVPLKAVSTLLSESGDLKARLEALKNVAAKDDSMGNASSSSLENSSAADLLAQLNDLMADSDEHPIEKKEEKASQKVLAPIPVGKDSNSSRGKTKSRPSVSEKIPIPAKPTMQKKRKSKVQGLMDMFEAKKPPPRKKLKPNVSPSPTQMKQREEKKQREESDVALPEPRKSILKRSESSENKDKKKKSVTFNPKSNGLLPDNEIEEFLTKSGDEAKKSKKKSKSSVKKNESKEKEKKPVEVKKKAVEVKKTPKALDRPVISNKRRRRSKRKTVDLVPTSTGKPPVQKKEAKPIEKPEPMAEPKEAIEKTNENDAKTPLAQPEKEEADEESSGVVPSVKKPRMSEDMIKNRLKSLKKSSPTPKEPREKEESKILDVIANTRKSLRKTKTRESKIMQGPKNVRGAHKKYGRELEKGEITVDMVQDTRKGLKKAKSREKKEYKVHRIVRSNSDASSVSDNSPQELNWDLSKMKERQSEKEKLQIKLMASAVPKKRKSRVEKLISGFQKTHKMIREEAESTGSLSPNYPCPYCKEKIHIGESVYYGERAKWHQTCWNIKQQEELHAKLKGRPAGEIVREALSPATETKEQFNKIIKKRHRRGPSLSICGRCKRQVFLNDDCAYFGRVLWHRSCFRCENCNRAFYQNEEWRTHEGLPWCERCYIENFPDEVAPMDNYDIKNPVAILKFEPSYHKNFVYLFDAIVLRAKVYLPTTHTSTKEIYKGFPYNFWHKPSFRAKTYVDFKFSYLSEFEKEIFLFFLTIFCENYS